MFADDKLLKSAGMRDAEFPVRDFKVEAELPSGNKTVRIVFPWSVSPKIKNFELSWSTYVRPVAKKHKMIIYGDSITQGYDCTHPSASYASRITDFLCADFEDYRPFGAFSEAREFIMKTAEELPNATAVDCFDFVPHDRKYFSDAYLHPNDEGFGFYSDALIEKIKEII